MPRCDWAAVRIGRWRDLLPEACKPGARSDGVLSSRAPHHAARLQAPAVFSDHRCQRFFIEAQVSHQLFQPAVLVFERTQALRIADFHAAVLRLPVVQRLIADAHLSRDLLRASPCFHLLHCSDDLLLAVLRLFHLESSFPFSGTFQIMNGSAFQEQVSGSLVLRPAVRLTVSSKRMTCM